MKDFLGVLAVCIALYSYIPYFRDIFKGKTKPHAFSWFVWGLMTAIAFFAQVSGGAKAGAWATGFTALICFVIFGCALKYGRKNIVAVDWFFLGGAMFSLALWAVTKDPLASVLIITIVDMLAFVPTFRKSYHKPHEETVATYSLSALKFLIAMFALNTFTITTALYPLSLVLTNSLFVAMVYVRRGQLARQAV